MKKTTLGLILGNINPGFEFDITQGVNKYAQEHGINIITFVSTATSKDSFISDYIFDSYKLIGIDALVIIYGSLTMFKNNAEIKDFLNKFVDIPYVIVQDSLKIEGKSNLIVDNKKGLKECINHLAVDHNCKKILYFSGPKDNYDSIERLNAYKEAMAENHLKVTKDMIAYGNFGIKIENELRTLLMKNKKADAIVFANDTMALASYPILEQLGYKIGKDILITGFDDMYKASIAHPALTTVSQDPFKLGYESSKEAVRMIREGNNRFIMLNTNLIIRKSCGCRNVLGKNDDLKKITEEEIVEHFITESALTSQSNINLKKLKMISTNVLKRLKSNYTADEIVYYIKNAILDDDQTAITNYHDIFSYFNTAMKKYINFVNDPIIKEKTSTVLYNLQTWYFCYITNKMDNDNKLRLDRIENISLICRKMLNDQLSKYDMFENIFSELKEIGVKSSYIYLLDDKNINIVTLAAYFNEKEIQIYRKNELSNNIPLNTFINEKTGSFSYCFSLSSNEKTYGFIVCETDLGLLNSIKLLCSQIGTLLYVEEIRKRELKAQIDLKKSFKMIKKQNEILNNISLYDELTKIYNRRGFIEKSIELINNNIGSDIVIIFCDLDHLKEINDTFGHKEGDFAIENAARLLVKSLPESAIISRIGGDEFVAMTRIDENITTNKINQEIKNNFAKFNKICDKPYYVETSVGLYQFKGEESILVANLISEADKYLYEAKKHRRKSIKKINNKE